MNNITTNDASLILENIPTDKENTRSQHRINIASQVMLLVASSGKKCQGKLSNISWGGCRVLTKESLGDVNDSIGLLLPDSDGKSIKVIASIVRSLNSDEGYYAALRFSSLRSEDESRLEELLTSLINEGDQSSCSNTHFSQHIDVYFRDKTEIKATLRDISTGGMRLTTSRLMKLNQSIQIHLKDADESFCFHLRGRIIRLKRLGASNSGKSQVSLKFEHPINNLRSMVNTLINNMIRNERNRISESSNDVFKEYGFK